MTLSPFAGVLPTEKDLVNVDQLLHAYENEAPDARVASQRISFGTSGHRGSALDRSFNKNHILAMSQAICDYRKGLNLGPLFLGYDTHALSRPAFETALEVFAANDIDVRIAPGGNFTPTPVISHAILTYNRGRTEHPADGVVITPSHNPPQDGGFKYNPTNGGPAGKDITDVIQSRANALLEANLSGVKRVSFTKGRAKEFDFVGHYVNDLVSIIDFAPIGDLAIAVDPLGGAGVNYWGPIADKYKLNLKILNTKTDPAFRFVTRDWDGKIRMDPSSQYAMKSLLKESKNYRVAFACDTDHDRHGIVTPAGLMPANNYLATMIDYLFRNRPDWKTDLMIGKTLVSSSIIDRVAKRLSRKVYEVPVGFKWFVDGLMDGSLGFVGEESAGASFLRRNGEVWTTDKDAFVPSLLSAEMTARTGRDPQELYSAITAELGQPSYGRIDQPTTAKQKQAVAALGPANLTVKTLGGDPITSVATKAPGNGAAIGGVKIETTNGWVAIRPSGTEDILKVYGESFRGPDHLQKLFDDAGQIVAGATAN